MSSRYLSILLLLLLQSCSTTSNKVFIDRKFALTLQSVKTSNLEREVAQKVVFLTDKEIVSWVHMKVDSKKGQLSLVVSSLFGVPILTLDFTDSSKIVASANQGMPEPRRVLLDIQIMYWPKEAILRMSPNLQVEQSCNDSGCYRYIMSGRDKIYSVICYQDKLEKSSLSSYVYQEVCLNNRIKYKNILNGYDINVTNIEDMDDDLSE